MDNLPSEVLINIFEYIGPINDILKSNELYDYSIKGKEWDETLRKNREKYKSWYVGNITSREILNRRKYLVDLVNCKGFFINLYINSPNSMFESMTDKLMEHTKEELINIIMNLKNSRNIIK